MFALVMFRFGQAFDTAHRLGALVDGNRVLDLRVAIQHHRESVLGDDQAAEIAAVRAPASMRRFVAGGAHCLDEASAAVAAARALGLPDHVVLRSGRHRLALPLAEVELGCPIRPGKIVSAGRNYFAHQAESSMPPPDDFPRGFIRVSSSLIGPGPIPYPQATRQFDYEVELAVVIGRAGRDIPVERAMEHVFGYTVHNDLSARDWQLEERKKGNHLLGKNLDATGAFGPGIVPRAFIEDPMKLDIALHVNGQRRQSSNTGLMMYSIAQLVAHWSKMTLEPGDILCTGTPEGVAVGRKSDSAAFYLKVGDVVEAEVQHIGVLRNLITD